MLRPLVEFTPSCGAAMQTSSLEVLALAALLGGCVIEPPRERELSVGGELAVPVEEERVAAPVAVEEPSCASAPSETPSERICRRWRCEAPNSAPPAAWDGNGASCSPGRLDADAAARALRRINLHRDLAGLDPIAFEDEWIDSGQACAVLAHANAKLSHDPGRDWACWSQLGASTSAVSLIANRSAEVSIRAYFEDPGNETTMSHRRWLLSPTLERVGFGSTDRYSCVVLDGPNRPKRSSLQPPTWVAWPPPGLVPMQVFESELLDTAGWTIQSETESLELATVSVSADDRTMPVRTTHLEPLRGSRSALRFVPDGWRTTPGVKYTVRVTPPPWAVEPETVFTVEPIGC
jgi:hypothetical protein